jgi:hypothetical protein
MGDASRFFLAMIIMVAPASALAAGGAFVVDDVDIDKPGACKVESWASAASNHDFSAVTSPACVVKLGIPVELGGLLQRSRSDGAWSTTGALKAKVNLIPAENHPFGLAISGFSSWNMASGANTGGFINVPVTIPINNKFKINVNGGWLYDNVAKIGYATWGAGFEWGFVDKFTLIGEVFGQAGTLPAVNPGDPPPPNATVEPRTQLGLRFTPQENIDIDVIWGHNVTGENSQWGTLGLNVRF